MSTQNNKLNFEGQNIYVGMDVHKNSWKITIMTDVITHKTFVQSPQPEILSQYLHKHFPKGIYHSAYEAGFCGYWIHHKLTECGIKSIVVNPADVPTTNKEKVQRDDPRDSRKIARSLCNGELTPIYIPKIKTLEDRALLRTRSMLVKDLTRNKNRIKAFLFFHGIEMPEQFEKSQTHWSKRFMNWLETIEISEESGQESLNVLIAGVKNIRTVILNTNRSMRELSKTEAYSQNVALLQSIPGIGLLTAMIILVEIEDINRFSNIDKLAAFIGLIPSSNSSGEKEKIGDITSRGHNILRKTLIESAWIAARIDPALMKCYIEYCKRMAPNNAIIRIAHKLLSRIRFVLKNKKPYELSKIK
jgi:transposase